MVVSINFLIIDYYTFTSPIVINDPISKKLPGPLNIDLILSTKIYWGFTLNKSKISRFKINVYVKIEFQSLIDKNSFIFIGDYKIDSVRIDSIK